MKFILGKKLGMTQIFATNGEVIPVTKIQAGPCQIVQIKNSEKNNSKAVEIGFAEQKLFRLRKPQVGHLKDLKPVKFLRSFSTENVDNLNRGDIITVDIFTLGEKVTVTASSKGKGFAGVVKRHHFKGAPKTHGHKHDLRAPGSIGAGGVQRVFKGKKMAGRMGGQPVTIKNLEIIEINSDLNEIYIKGAVPGAKNTLIKIYCPGELVVKKIEEVKEIEAIKNNSEIEERVNEAVIEEITTEVKDEAEKVEKVEKIEEVKEELQEASEKIETEEKKEEVKENQEAENNENNKDDSKE